MLIIGLPPSSRPTSGQPVVSRPPSSKSRPMSASAGSRPASGRSRPASGGSRPGSRPGTGKSRPSTGLVISRPSTAASSRPGSAKAWSESETTPSSPRSELSADDNPLLAETEEVPKGCWHR